MEVLRELKKVPTRILRALGGLSMLPRETNLSLTEHPHRDVQLEVLDPIVTLDPAFNTSGR